MMQNQQNEIPSDGGKYDEIYRLLFFIFFYI